MERRLFLKKNCCDVLNFKRLLPVNGYS